MTRSLRSGAKSPDWLDRKHAGWANAEVKKSCNPECETDFRIAVLIYSMTNAVIFGAGIITVLNVSAGEEIDAKAKGGDKVGKELATKGDKAGSEERPRYVWE